MTYQDFKTKYVNQYWDFDGAYGFQCQDLIGFYSQELGLPHLGGNAADVAGQYPAGWLHVSVPTQGDVVVFARNAANGYYGHIAIYDSPGYFLSQNYPTGSNTHIQYINEPIIAILRPTNLQGGTMAEDPTQQIADLWARLGEAQAQVNELQAQNGQNVTQINNLVKQLTGTQVQVEQLRAQTAGVITKDQVIKYIGEHLS